MDILVVDPEAETRLLFFAAADQLGCEVYFAESGGEAMQVLAQHDSIGMILIAVLLPDIEPEVLAQRVRCSQQGRYLPIVFLSATEDTDTLVNLLDFGDDVVIKPFSQPVLLAKLLAIQRTHQLYAQIEQHNVQLENYRAQIESDHQIATDVFSRFLTQNLSAIAGITTFASPFSSFNGDLLLMAPRPGEGFNVLVADITGHGLPAALGTMPIAEIFFSLTERGVGVGDIAREMNTVFRARMPDYLLCAAALMAVMDNGRRIQIWSGGMPPLVIFDRQGRVESLLPSSHMALGALARSEFEDDIFSLDFQRGQRVLCYTDGITETSNAEREMFGEERLIAALTGGASGEAAVEQLTDALYRHAAGVSLSDDATVFCLDTALYTGFGDGTDLRANADYAQWNGFSWRMQMQFNARQIKAEQPLDLLYSSLPAHPIIRAARADLSLIVTELFANALDHGLLGMDSALKERGEGLMEYYLLREQRLQSLQEGLISFDLSCRVKDGVGEFHIQCEDSGTGFDYAALLARQQDDSQCSGRGLRMIAAIGANLTINRTGNGISLDYRWPANDN